MPDQDLGDATESIRKVVEQYEAKRLSYLADVARTERMINDLLRDIGEPEKYAVSSPSVAPAVTARKKRSRYYGKPLATAVRTYLDSLDEQPASPQEILAELEAGEFDFDGMGWQKEGRLRSLAMSLSKNTVTFHRLPSGAFGLVDWYPNARPRKAKTSPADGGTETEEATEEGKSE